MHIVVALTLALIMMECKNFAGVSAHFEKKENEERVDSINESLVRTSFL